MWNRHSEITRLVLEESQTRDADILFQRGAVRDIPNWEAKEQRACAGFSRERSLLWYSPKNMNWVEDDADIKAAARIYAHEIGHFLNLSHNSEDGSIMRENRELVSCREFATSVLPTTIPDADLGNARACSYKLRQKCGN